MTFSICRCCLLYSEEDMFFIKIWRKRGKWENHFHHITTDSNWCAKCYVVLITVSHTAWSLGGKCCLVWVLKVEEDSNLIRCFAITGSCRSCVIKMIYKIILCCQVIYLQRKSNNIQKTPYFFLYHFRHWKFVILIWHYLLFCNSA